MSSLRIHGACRPRAQLPGLLSGVLMGIATSIPLAAMAQTAAPPPAMTTEKAMAALPNPERYRLEISNKGLGPQARQTLSKMLVDTIGKDHFFGAIYAFLPRGSKQLSIHLRRKLHSVDAAERSALQDCEAERNEGDSECYQIGRIIPENWKRNDAPALSHEAMFAFSKNSGKMEGPKFVARSLNTTAWAMWSGKGVRQSAIDECNEKVKAGGFKPDCGLAIDDSP